MSQPDVSDFSNVVSFNQRDLGDFVPGPAGLKGGGGGGTFDGMPPDIDKRVTSLETKVDQTRIEIAELKGKVSQLPTVWTLVFANLGLAVTVAALVFGVARAMK